jgi:Uma2 family endonuclease
MNMQVVLPDEALPAKLTLNPDLQMNDDEYYEFCMANADVRFERTEEGEIIIVPPAGVESDHQSLDVARQLYNWAERDGRGQAFGATAEFILSNRAALSPDAAWVSNLRLAEVSREQRRKFPPVSPEFVVEVMSPSDRLRTAKKKMETWITGGVELGWLIHPDDKTVYVYRSGQNEPTQQTGIAKLAGEGPVAGFELDLRHVWAGL